MLTIPPIVRTSFGIFGRMLWFAFLKVLSIHAAIFFAVLPFFIPESTRARHTYICGASGSGKSELIKALVYTYLRRPWFGLQANAVTRRPMSIIVLDPAGDMPKQIAHWPEVASNPDQVAYIDPTLSDKHVIRINPFDQLPLNADERTIDRWVEYLAIAFAQLSSRGGFADASGNMRVLLTPILHVLLRRPGSTIEDLQAFMVKERNEPLIALGRELKNPAHANFFTDKFESKHFDRAREAIYSRMQDILNATPLRRVLMGKSTIRLADVVNRGSVVLFRFPKGGTGLESAPTMGTLITSLLQAIAFDREPLPEHERTPTHLFIDEAQNYINHTLQEILDELRKFGLHVTLATQHTDQLPEDIRESVLTNCATIMTGIAAAKTVRRLSNEFNLKGFKLRRLKPGQFYLKRKGPYLAHRFRVPFKLVKFNHRVSDADWKAFVKFQLATHYEPINGRPAQLECPKPLLLEEGARSLLIPAAARKKQFV